MIFLIDFPNIYLSDLSVVSDVIIHSTSLTVFIACFSTISDLLELIKTNDNCGENYVICDQSSHSTLRSLQVNDEK